MCLLITVTAAITATVVWYLHSEKDTYKVRTLATIYWGASLMWFIDFIYEYAQRRAEYFVQSFSDILNDTLLGAAVTVLGLGAWLVMLLIKDPKGTFVKK